MSAKVPNSPTKTPTSCFLTIESPNNKIPTKEVNRGTVELKIAVTPLSSSVCANANKKGGKKELKNPAMTSHFMSGTRRLAKLLKPKVNKIRDAKTMRNAPNCNGEKPNNDLLIRIKEEPHIKDNMIR